MRRTILVTGAGGFIGGWVCEAFHLAGWANVRAGVRSWSGAARIARFPFEIVECDVLDSDSLARALRGVEAVVHCVNSDDRRVVVEGTGNLLRAASAHGIRHVVYLSSAEVYGQGAAGAVDESTPLLGGNGYADAKIAAEALCREHGDPAVGITILRPSIVYGPYGETWSVGMAARLASGRWRSYEGAFTGLCNAVYVGDLVRAIRRILERREQAAGEAFNVAGPELVTWEEYFDLFARHLGLGERERVTTMRGRGATIGYDLLRGAATPLVTAFREPLLALYERNPIARRLMKGVKTALSSTPSGVELSGLYGRRVRYSDLKLRFRLDFQPLTGLDSGLGLTALWLAQVGLIEARSRPLGSQRVPAPEGTPKETVS